MAEGVTFTVPSLQVTENGQDETTIVQEQNSQMLADALARMDGLIGDFRPTSELIEVSLVNDPVVRLIVEQATALNEQMKVWDDAKREVEGHPKDCIPANIREAIIKWLSSKSQNSGPELERLRQDKAELLKQVVSQEQQLEALNNDREKLSTKVADLECRVIEKEEHCRGLSEELRLTKTTLNTKEVEVRQLRSEIKAGLKAAPPTKNEKYRRVTIEAPPSQDKSSGGNSVNRKSSFKVLAQMFRKKPKAVSLDQSKENSSPVKPANVRASAFYSMNSDRLSEWFASIGLDMYGDLVSHNLLTGEALAGMVSRPGNAEFVRMGIVSTLHCKKLRLAVEDALKESPSAVGDLDHHWVGQWLVNIGLPQYQRTFLDARFDGRMLNVVTIDDLKLLEVVTPFHVASIKRAIQALRMCGYDRDYLKCSSSSHGNKLLHWSAETVERWIRGIELGEYVEGLGGHGIHGAIMLLDVQFTTESLARALGVSATKTLIRTHLSRKFMELIGPIAAQDKVDALQSKNFVPLDPTEVPKGRPRSRSMGSRRGRNPVPEVLLCPFSDFPENIGYTRGNSAAALNLLASPTSTRSTVSDNSPSPRPPTP